MQSIDVGDDLPAPDPGTGDRASAHPSGTVGAGPDHLALTLSLNDLLPDANGEIVIVSGAGESHLSIVTDQQVCDAGVAAQHVTAEGFDVGGLAYYAFESGTRLYYSPDLDLTIARGDLG